MRRRRHIAPIPDDGLTGSVIGPAPDWWAHDNASKIMAGFDDLPKSLRDRINYAETPEAGARPARDLAREIKDKARAEARSKALDSNGVKLIWA